MSEAEIVSSLDEKLAAGQPIYLPAELPPGFAAAAPRQPFRWGGFDWYSGDENPSRSAISDSNFAVMYTDGHRLLGLLVNLFGDHGDIPIRPAAVRGVYGPLEVVDESYATTCVVVPSLGSGRRNPGIEVIAYQEDLDVALALARTVRFVRNTGS